MSIASVSALDIDIATIDAGVVMNVNDSVLYNIMCGTIKDYTIPKSFTEIRAGLFYNCDDLEVISIPNTVKKIGERAFYNCNSLTKVKIPAYVTRIDDLAFNNCSLLNKVYFLGKPEYISENIFEGCNDMDIYVSWATEAMPGSPWGATNANIHYSTRFDINNEPII